LVHQNNYVENLSMMNNIANVLAISLSVLHKLF